MSGPTGEAGRFVSETVKLDEEFDLSRPEESFRVFLGLTPRRFSR
jgi:hypothetical protein